MRSKFSLLALASVSAFLRVSHGRRDADGHERIDERDLSMANC